MRTMKYTIATVALMCSGNLFAQGFKVIKTDGSVVTFPSVLVNRVEFFPASEVTPSDYIIDPTGTPPSTSNDKEFLEKTGKEFINQFQADDFSNITEIIKHIKDYDRSELEEWADGCLDDMKTLIGDIKTETYRDTSYYYWNESYSYYTYIYNYANYKYLLRASAFKGHFSVQNGKWVCTEADDLKATFKDRLGNDCVIKLTTSGATKTIHLMKDTDSDYKWNSWYDNLDNYYNERTIDRNYNDFYVDIPEHITLTFTQGGKTIISTKADIDISQIKAENWDLSRDGISTTVKAQVNNYEVVIDRASYSPENGASVKFELKKNGNIILYGGADAGGYLTEKYSDDEEEDEEDVPGWGSTKISSSRRSSDVDISSVGAANITLNVLGWMRINATTTNVYSVKKTLENIDDNKTNEDEIKRYASRLNELLKANFYYLKEETSRGTISAEAFLDHVDNYLNREYWDVKPIITFTSDGSSYAIDNYFTEDSFKTVVDTFRNLLDDFEDLWDTTGIE